MYGDQTTTITTTPFGMKGYVDTRVQQPSKQVTLPATIPEDRSVNAGRPSPRDGAIIRESYQVFAEAAGLSRPQVDPDQAEPVIADIREYLSGEEAANGGAVAQGAGNDDGAAVAQSTQAPAFENTSNDAAPSRPGRRGSIE